MKSLFVTSTNPSVYNIQTLDIPPSLVSSPHKIRGVGFPAYTILSETGNLHTERSCELQHRLHISNLTTDALLNDGAILEEDLTWS